MKREREEGEAFQADFLSEAVAKKISQYNGIENAEIETRLCIMNNKASRNERLRLPIESAAILAAPHNVTIGVDRNNFEKLLAAFRDAGYESTTVSSETATFNEGERVEKNDQGKVSAYLKKRKLTTIDILIPGSPFDLRIGVATETQLALADAPTIPADAFIRQRNRTTFTLPNNMVADFTVIGSGTPRPIYEVEIEMTFPKLEADAKWVSEIIQAAKRLIDIAKQRPKPVAAPAPKESNPVPEPAAAVATE